MKRKNFISISILTFVLFLSSLSFSDGRVLLMVPHEDQLIKVGLDLSERHPSLLISYKLGADNTPQSENALIESTKKPIIPAILRNKISFFLFFIIKRWKKIKSNITNGPKYG